MNSALLQSKIYKGGGKAAEKVGFPYNQYRFTSPLNPIISGNLISTIKATFSKDYDFKKPKKYDDPLWYCWANGNNLHVFDLLVNDDESETYYIAAMQHHLPIQAIQCNHSITIKRPNYTTSGDIQQNFDTLATNFPCFIKNNGMDVKTPEFESKTAGESITRWQLFIPVARDTIQKSDLVIDENNNKYIIDAPDYTDIGYVCTMRLAAP